MCWNNCCYFSQREAVVCENTVPALPLLPGGRVTTVQRKKSRSVLLLLASIFLAFIPALAVAVAKEMPMEQSPPAGDTKNSILEMQGQLLPGKYGKFRIWQHGFLRVHFMEEGEEAVARADGNGNNCPDVVEDIAVQVVAAHRIYCELIGFPAPLGSSRYHSVQFVDIIIRAPSVLRKNRGLAFDDPSMRLHSAPYPGIALLPHSPKRQHKGKVPVLVIGISNTVNPQTNPTPAHEYFHQIQNGNTHIKNAWLSEGTSVWAEEPFRTKATTAKGSLPSKAVLTRWENFREDLFRLSYKAGPQFWQPLTQGCSSASFFIPSQDPVLRLKYTSGSPVVRQAEVTGAFLVQKLFILLRQKEKEVFVQHSYGSWTEQNQRRPENNIVVWQAVRNATAAICP